MIILHFLENHQNNPEEIEALSYRRMIRGERIYMDSELLYQQTMGMLDDMVSFYERLNHQMSDITTEEAHALYAGICAVREELKYLAMDLPQGNGQIK